MLTIEIDRWPDDWILFKILWILYVKDMAQTYLYTSYNYVSYSCVHNSIERLFWAGNQGNHQNFHSSLLAYNC